MLSSMDLNLHALEESFDLVAPLGDELMDEFYGRLFEAAPAVKPLFARTDMSRQKAMLLAALVLVRKSLRDLDSIVPKLRDLGARHVAYGAEPAHYPVVAEVLIASSAAWTGATTACGSSVRTSSIRTRRRRPACTAWAQSTRRGPVPRSCGPARW